MRHHRLRVPAEERQQIVNQPALRGIPGYGRFKNMEVAHFLDAAQSLLSFQPIDGGLNGGVGWPVAFWKCLLDLADGSGAAGPQRIHDLKLEFGQLGLSHSFYYIRLRVYYDSK